MAQKTMYSEKHFHAQTRAVAMGILASLLD